MAPVPFGAPDFSLWRHLPWLGGAGPVERSCGCVSGDGSDGPRRFAKSKETRPHSFSFRQSKARIEPLIQVRNQARPQPVWVSLNCPRPCPAVLAGPPDLVPANLVVPLYTLSLLARSVQPPPLRCPVPFQPEVELPPSALNHHQTTSLSRRIPGRRDFLSQDRI